MKVVGKVRWMRIIGLRERLIKADQLNMNTHLLLQKKVQLFLLIKVKIDKKEHPYECSFSLFPVKIIVMIGLSIQKKANGRYVSTGTPRTSAMNTPQTLHGTSGLMTVPASSSALDNALAGNFAC